MLDKAKTTSASAEPEARKISLEKRMNPKNETDELKFGKDESTRKYLTAHETGRAERTVERRRRL